MVFILSPFFFFSPVNEVNYVFPGKKDAEGWETVQRGRTAKPRSAAVVAKVSPVLAHATPKQDNAKGNRSHVPPQDQKHLCPEGPPDKGVTHTNSGQQVTAEPDALDEVLHPENGQIMEVLMSSTL